MNTCSHEQTGFVRSPPQAPLRVQQPPLRVQQPPAQTMLEGDLSSPDVVFWGTGSISDRFEVRLGDIERTIQRLERHFEEGTATVTENLRCLIQFSEAADGEIFTLKQAQVNASWSMSEPLDKMERRFDKTETTLEEVFERMEPVITGLVRLARKADPEEANKFEVDFEIWFKEVAKQ